MPNDTCGDSLAAVADLDPGRRTWNIRPPGSVDERLQTPEKYSAVWIIDNCTGAELVSTLIDRGRRSEPRFRVTSLNRSEKQQLLTLTSTHSLPN